MPSLASHPVVLTLVGLALVATTVHTLWHRAVLPIASGIARIWRAAMAAEAAIETLAEIAFEFRPNHGTSLRDSMDRLESGQKELTDYVHTFRHDTANRFMVIETNVRALADLTHVKDLVDQSSPSPFLPMESDD